MRPSWGPARVREREREGREVMRVLARGGMVGRRSNI